MPWTWSVQFKPKQQDVSTFKSDRLFYFPSYVLICTYFICFFMISPACPTHYCDFIQTTGCGTGDAHTAAVIFSSQFPFLFFSWVQSSRCTSCPLFLFCPWLGVAKPCPRSSSSPPITVTVTCVLWPRRSVSRSQQWKQSLNSTLSGPSRSQKKSRTSWTPSTSRQQRRGECLALYVSVSSWVLYHWNLMLLMLSCFVNAMKGLLR